jgi:flagellar biosynthesis/type III secretory pathway M-ring protein FliF/YscJ
VSILIAILSLVLVAVVVAVVSAPLRSGRRTRGVPAGAQPAERHGSRSELEAAREAKYREIRDAELDYRTGKLSREDYDAIDGELRAEAIEILDRLEGVEVRPRGA